ncbi:MAG TPA: helix-turn-helix domain-containing protein, partial [Solirubrobacterales bacterium]|nr:helix-turn-helix domain-containing protein [Solirubrobacterales bacterium]
MLDREYDNQVCSIARSLEVVGERWSLLIIRNVGLGLNRFEPLRENLGITRSVLTTRLNTLIEYGILEKRQYSEKPPRFEYHLTQKGRDLSPVL